MFVVGDQFGGATGERQVFPVQKLRETLPGSPVIPGRSQSAVGEQLFDLPFHESEKSFARVRFPESLRYVVHRIVSGGAFQRADRIFQDGQVGVDRALYFSQVIVAPGQQDGCDALPDAVPFCREQFVSGRDLNGFLTVGDLVVNRAGAARNRRIAEFDSHCCHNFPGLMFFREKDNDGGEKSSFSR